jgi:hypothetical protein
VTLRARWVTLRARLGDAKSSLGDVKSLLGAAYISLGGAKSSLGDAKSSLGDAKSSLGDGHISVGDVQVVPEQLVGGAASFSTHGPTPRLAKCARERDDCNRNATSQKPPSRGSAPYAPRATGTQLDHSPPPLLLAHTHAHTLSLTPYTRLLIGCVCVCGGCGAQTWKAR